MSVSPFLSDYLVFAFIAFGELPSLLLENTDTKLEHQSKVIKTDNLVVDVYTKYV